MMFKFISFLVFLFLWSIPTLAHEEPTQLELLKITIPCGDRDIIFEGIITKYNESVTWRGVATPEIMFELFTNTETTGWTMFITKPIGVTCLLGSGTGSRFKRAPEKSKGPPT